MGPAPRGRGGSRIRAVEWCLSVYQIGYTLFVYHRGSEGGYAATAFLSMRFASRRSG